MIAAASPDRPATRPARAFADRGLSGTLLNSLACESKGARDADLSAGEGSPSGSRTASLACSPPRRPALPLPRFPHRRIHITLLRGIWFLTISFSRCPLFQIPRRLANCTADE